MSRYCTAPQARTKNPYPRRWDARSGQHYYQHRAIAEWRLGRPLHQSEGSPEGSPRRVVHPSLCSGQRHANGDPKDNHPDFRAGGENANIWVFSSQRAHMLFEHYLKREARGIGHLFAWRELLQHRGEYVLTD